MPRKFRKIRSLGSSEVSRAHVATCKQCGKRVAFQSDQCFICLLKEIVMHLRESKKPLA